MRQHRNILEPALLDPLAKPGFDALEQLLVVEADDKYNPQLAPPPITQQRNWLFSEFEFTTSVVASYFDLKKSAR